MLKDLSKVIFGLHRQHLEEGTCLEMYFTMMIVRSCTLMCVPIFRLTKGGGIGLLSALFDISNEGIVQTRESEIEHIASTAFTEFFRVEGSRPKILPLTERSHHHHRQLTYSHSV